MASDKTYTKKVKPYFIRTKYGTYSQCNFVTSRQEMSKRAKLNKTTNEIIERFFFTTTESD